MLCHKLLKKPRLTPFRCSPVVFYPACAQLGHDPPYYTSTFTVCAGIAKSPGVFSRVIMMIAMEEIMRDVSCNCKMSGTKSLIVTFLTFGHSVNDNIYLHLHVWPSTSTLNSFKLRDMLIRHYVSRTGKFHGNIKWHNLTRT